MFREILFAPPHAKSPVNKFEFQAQVSTLQITVISARHQSQLDDYSLKLHAINQLIYNYYHVNIATTARRLGPSLAPAFHHGVVADPSRPLCHG